MADVRSSRFRQSQRIHSPLGSLAECNNLLIAILEQCMRFTGLCTAFFAAYLHGTRGFSPCADGRGFTGSDLSDSGLVFLRNENVSMK